MFFQCFFYDFSMFFQCFFNVFSMFFQCFFYNFSTLFLCFFYDFFMLFLRFFYAFFYVCVKIISQKLSNRYKIPFIIKTFKNCELKFILFYDIVFYKKRYFLKLLSSNFHLSQNMCNFFGISGITKIYFAVRKIVEKFTIL